MNLRTLFNRDTLEVGEDFFSSYPFVPENIVSGTCPRVPGEEETIVWHAAAEACDAERVHVAYQIVDDTIWYIACPSSDLGSRKGSWCPFAGLLPGGSDATGIPAVYIFKEENGASVFVVSDDGPRILRGPSAVMLEKSKSIASTLGCVVQDISDILPTLTPNWWKSLHLMDDKVRGATLKWTVGTCLVTALVAAGVWAAATIQLPSSYRAYDESATAARASSMRLLEQARFISKNELREQVFEIESLNNELLRVGGQIMLYEIDGNATKWRAILPPAITGDFIQNIGGNIIEIDTEGRPIVEGVR